MKLRRPMKSSEGRGEAIAYAPRLVDLQSKFLTLNSREARVAFIDTWLKTWAHDFEKTWPVIYQLLEWVEAEKLYQDPRAVDPKEVYPDFKSYFEARLKRPFTLWMELEQTHRYVSKYAPELIEKTFAEARAEAARKAQESDAQDRASQRPVGRPRAETVYNNESDVHNSGRSSGNTRAAALRRLRKDRPDIHARVLAGETTPHAGMVEAGFRKPTKRKKPTAMQHAKKWIAKLSLSEWEQLKRDENTRRQRTPAGKKRRHPNGQMRLV